MFLKTHKKIVLIQINGTVNTILKYINDKSYYDKKKNAINVFVYVNNKIREKIENLLI